MVVETEETGGESLCGPTVVIAGKKTKAGKQKRRKTDNAEGSSLFSSENHWMTTDDSTHSCLSHNSTTEKVVKLTNSIPKPTDDDPKAVLMLHEQVKHWLAYGDQKWVDFEAVANGFFKPISNKTYLPFAKCGITTFEHHKRGGGNRRGAENEAPAHKTYYKSMKKTFEKVCCPGVNGECNLDCGRLEDYFSGVYKKDDGFLEEGDDDFLVELLQRAYPKGVAEVCETKKKERFGGLMCAFTPGSIFFALNKHRDTSPGEDGIKYSDLLKLDPNCTALAAIFNVCLRYGKVPVGWKRAKVTLIYKKGDANVAANYRPIALMSTTYKLYTGMLAKRLLSECTSEGLVSAEQKGFMPESEGCLENVFLLDDAIHEARSDHKDLVVTWLDLTNAFGSVSHKLIERVMAQIGLPREFRDIVSDLYCDAYCSVKSSRGLTRPLAIERGVKQGDPLSPVLFNLAIEPLIRHVRGLGLALGFQGYMGAHIIQAYADDIVLFTKKPEDMNMLLKEVCLCLKTLGLECNARKSGTLTLKGGCLKRGVVYSMGDGNNVLPSLELHDVYTYLGNPCGIGIDQCPMEVIATCMHQLSSVTKSRLLPWQKLDAIKRFISPKMSYLFRASEAEMGSLRELDKMLVDSVRKICKLGRASNHHYFFGTTSSGCLGVTSFTEEYHIQAVAHTFRLLTSGDAALKAQAWRSLEAEVTRWVKRKPTREELILFLNGSTASPLDTATCGRTPRCIWKKLRKCVRPLKQMLNLEFGLNDRSEIELSFNLKGYPGHMDGENRGMIYKILRSSVANYHAAILRRDYPSQGAVFASVAKCPPAARAILGGVGISASTWQFVHGARLNLLPVNGRNYQLLGKKQCVPSDLKCRHCSYEQESLQHVLGHCPYGRKKQVRARHDNIVKRCVRVIGALNKERLKDKRMRMWTEKTCTAANRQVRPDITIFETAGKTVHFIDVTCPFEWALGGDSFKLAREGKREKYRPEQKALEVKGYRVFNDAIIVGPLGTWDPRNDVVLERLNLDSRTISRLRSALVKDTLTFSKNIFWQHAMGDIYKPLQDWRCLEYYDTVTTSSSDVENVKRMKRKMKKKLKRNRVVVATDSSNNSNNNMCGKTNVVTYLMDSSERVSPPQPKMSRVMSNDVVHIVDTAVVVDDITMKDVTVETETKRVLKRKNIDLDRQSSSSDSLANYSETGSTVYIVADNNVVIVGNNSTTKKCMMGSLDPKVLT